MRCQCPTCGSEIERELPLVCLESNTISYRNRTIRVNATEAELAYVIVENWPRTVRHSELAMRIYGIGGPERVAENIRTQLCRLRQKIKRIGLGIASVYCVGYSLYLHSSMRQEPIAHRLFTHRSQLKSHEVQTRRKAA